MALGCDQDEDLPMPVDQIGACNPCVTEGLIFQRLLTPELVPDEIFYAAFAAFAIKPQSAIGTPTREGRGATPNNQK
jgi:hypothetical protein